MQRAENRLRFDPQDRAPSHYSSAAPAILKKIDLTDGSADEDPSSDLQGLRTSVTAIFSCGILYETQCTCIRDVQNMELAAYIREDITVFTRDTCKKT